MAKKLIPDNVRKEVIKIVDEFNEIELSKVNYFYIVEFRGKFIYLKLNINNRIEPRGRLEYNGDLNSMSFAIFKYSSERYDSEEIFFPGVGFVDGTIKGGMKAGIESYPVESRKVYIIFKKLRNWCFKNHSSNKELSLV